MFNTLYHEYLHDLENNNQNSSIYINYLNDMSSDYKKTNIKRIVLDYISLMTDAYFQKEYESIINKQLSIQK